MKFTKAFFWYPTKSSSSSNISISSSSLVSSSSSISIFSISATGIQIVLPVDLTSSLLLESLLNISSGTSVPDSWFSLPGIIYFLTILSKFIKDKKINNIKNTAINFKIKLGEITYLTFPITFYFITY